MSTIQNIRSRVEKASPGPWERDTNVPFSTKFMGIFAPELKRYIIRAEDEPTTTRADAEFIAHAREDIPALLAIIDNIHALVMSTDGDYLEGSDFDGLVGEVQRVLFEGGVIPTSADSGEPRG